MVPENSIQLGFPCKGHVPLDEDIHNISSTEATILEIEHFIRCRLFGWWPDRLPWRRP